MLTMIPLSTKTNTQYPMMSFARNPAIASAGNAQNGWIIFVQASPYAIAMAVFA